MTLVYLIAFFGILIVALIATIESLVPPAFFDEISSLQIPDGIAYFADAFQLDFGLSVIVAAYTFRFILRRIPLIG